MPKLSGISEKQLLEALEGYNISVDTIREAVDMKKRQELLAMHTYKIWQAPDGRWNTRIKEGKGVYRRIAKKSRRALEDALVEHYMKEVDNPSVADIFHMWIDKKEKYGEIEPASSQRYRTDFRRFFEKSGFGNRRMEELTTDDLEDFIKAEIHEERLTQKTYSGLIILIKGILKTARKQGYTSIRETEFFEDLDIGKAAFTKKPKNFETEVLRQDEIPLVIDYLNERGTIWDLGVLLELETGARIGEISSLIPSDICEDYLRICRTESRRTVMLNGREKIEIYVKDYPKTEAGYRNVVLTDKAKATLKQILELRDKDSQWLLTGKGGQRVRGNTLNKRLADCLNDLGLVHRSSHKLRKTFGTELHEGGADDTVVASQLGHENIGTTRKYYIVGNQTRAEVIKQVRTAIQF